MPCFSWEFVLQISSIIWWYNLIHPQTLKAPNFQTMLDWNVICIARFLSLRFTSVQIIWKLQFGESRGFFLKRSLLHIKLKKFISSSYIWSWNELPFMALSYGKGYLHMQCLQPTLETKKMDEFFSELCGKQCICPNYKNNTHLNSK